MRFEGHEESSCAVVGGNEIRKKHWHEEWFCLVLVRTFLHEVHDVAARVCPGTACVARALRRSTALLRRSSCFQVYKNFDMIVFVVDQRHEAYSLVLARNCGYVLRQHTFLHQILQLDLLRDHLCRAYGPTRQCSNHILKVRLLVAQYSQIVGFSED